MFLPLLSDLSHAVEFTNRDLNMIYNWSKSYGLAVNPSKTQAIIIGSPFFSGLTPNCFWSGLTWCPQIEAIRKKVFGAYSSLNRLQNFLPTNTKITLAQTLLLSILDYADVCYADLSEELLNKLERQQNLCIRFIYNLKKYDHISCYRAQLNWLPIRRRI